MIGAVVNSKLATLHELETVYGLEGLYNLYEITAEAKWIRYDVIRSFDRPLMSNDMIVKVFSL